MLRQVGGFQVVHRIITITIGAVRALCENVPPDASAIAVRGSNYVIKVWGVPTGQLLYTLTTHSHTIASVKFVAYGAAMVYNSEDGTIRVWRAGNGQPLVKPICHPRIRSAIGAVPLTVFVKAIDSHQSAKVQVPDLGTGDLVRKFSLQPCTSSQLWWLPPDGHQIIAIQGIDVQSCSAGTGARFPYTSVGDMHYLHRSIDVNTTDAVFFNGGRRRFVFSRYGYFTPFVVDAASLQIGARCQILTVKVFWVVRLTSHGF
jgi:WD40 repeat protein